MADPNYQNSLSANRIFYEINRIIGCLWLLENDKNNALDYFESALEYVIAYNEYADESFYTSLMLGVECEQSSLWNKSAVQDMLYRITTQNRYDCLRDDKRFIKIVEALKEITKE